MYAYHDDGLYEKREVILCSRPVEYLQYGRREHDEGYVEGEASRCTSTIDGEDLIGVGGQWGEVQTTEVERSALLHSNLKLMSCALQERGERRDQGPNETHGGKAKDFRRSFLDLAIIVGA